MRAGSTRRGAAATSPAWPRANGPAGGGCRHPGPGPLLELLERTDAFRRPERLERLLEVCECDLRARGLARQVPRQRLADARAAALEVDAQAIAKANPQSVAAAIHAARAQRIRERLGGDREK